MKKLISMLMAAVFVVSVSLTNAFAASTSAKIRLSFTSAEAATDPALPLDAKLSAGEANLTLAFDKGNSVTLKNTKAITLGKKGSEVAAAFVGAEGEMRYDGILYTVKLNSAVLDSGMTNALEATIYPAGKVPFTLTSASLSPGYTGGSPNLGFAAGKSTVSTLSASYGSGGKYDGANTTLDIEQILYSVNGQAVPLVEDKTDLNNEGDGVRSGTDVYFLVNAPFDDERYFKLRASKGNNSKNIKDIDVVSKYFNKELYRVYGGRQMSGGLTTGRHTFIKVSLKELYTDDEYKITFDLRVSLTSSGEDRYPEYSETSIRAEDVTAIWLKNKVDKGDGDYRVGENGLMIKPLQNDWNEIVWYNEQSDLARLKFFADSDVKSFYSKLSTKWAHEDYASYFNDQDAYVFNFTGSPSLSSTSRADLEIYNPFIDGNGDETVNPHNITIYQVIDGDLYNVTDKWSYGENDDGYMAYSTRTRFLGTYIFCEKPVDEEEDPDEYLPPSNNIDRPALPDPTPGGKVPANTGKYL